MEEYYRFFEKEKDFKFGLQPSTLAKKTLGISYAEAEEFALSVYRQYVLNLPNDNVKEITERAIHSWQSQVIVAHKDQKGVETTKLLFLPEPLNHLSEGNSLDYSHPLVCSKPLLRKRH